MLRMQLKRFIIICTRIAREHFSVGADREKLFDTVRRYYVLVDEHFRTKKRVQDYAGLLHRSPKTLANLFASCGQPSPLNIIHDRVACCSIPRKAPRRSLTCWAMRIPRPSAVSSPK